METDYTINVPKDLKVMCRLCMTIPEDNSSFKHFIFGKPKFTRVHNLIRKYLKVKVANVEGLSNVVCNTCYDFLATFEAFETQCISVNKAITDLWKDYEKNRNSSVQMVEVEVPQCADVCFEANMDVSEDIDIEYFILKDEMDDADDAALETDANCNEREEVSKNTALKADDIPPVKSCEDTSVTPSKHSEDENDSHNCCLCSKSFPSKLFLCMHTVTHILQMDGIQDLLDYSKFNYCETCGQVFEKQADLHAHQSAEHIVPIEVKEIKLEVSANFQCPFCDMLTSTRSELDHHMLNHIVKKEHCTLCDGVFSFQAAYSQHLNLQHNEEYKHKCTHCHKVFKSKEVLKSHTTHVHMSTIKFICPTCGKSFKTQLYLTNHMKIHQEKNLICSYCGYATAKQDNLTKHIRIHTEERPYKCDYKNCGKTFKTASHRIDHLRRHLRIKNHLCTICEQSFGTQHSLKCHKMTHTGEKPHTCNVCHNTFRRIHHLKNHQKSHHRAMK